LPVSGSTMSNAALAAGRPQPLDNSHDLRITDPKAGGNGGNRAGQGTLTANDGTGAQLVPAIQTSDPGPRRDAPPADNLVSLASTRNGSYEQAQAQLAARGVIWQRLENASDTGEWKFSCAVPNRQNPNVHRTYEAKAKDFLSAMQAVLEQIDKERS
jgi:hypothetical protein